MEPHHSIMQQDFVQALHVHLLVDKCHKSVVMA